MMARAGSGKTYYISNDFTKTENVLFITFTNQNVENIRREIYKRFKNKPPNNYKIVTFSSFLYSWIIRPLEPLLPFNQSIESDGVDLITEPPPPSIKLANNYIVQNPLYESVDKIGHYLNKKNNQYFSSRMSRLIIKHLNKNKKTINRNIEERLEGLVDTIYIDEFQDYKGDDFKIINLLLRLESIRVTAVGDFYQHSVAPSFERSQYPYKKKKLDVTEEEFIDSFPKTKIDVDTDTLISSRRVTEDMCRLITDKLGIDIYSSNERKGKLKIISELNELKELLYDKNCTKLVFSNSSKFPYKPAINWSYSKGDTYSKTLVILTGNLENLLDQSFSLEKSNLSQSTLNKLYVALTRSNNETYICTKKTYDKYNLNKI